MPAGLAIHRFSARTPARAQPVAARLALQALGADLEDALPRSLPPQALLWLRRLQLQAPEAALLRPAPAAWRQDWITAGRERLAAALAQAARPALGPVPDSAPAVLFADAAEMLACLALAAQAGQMDRWWWRGLLGRAWPRWEKAWASRPEAQAGAVRLLVRMGQGGAVAAWGEMPAAVRPPSVVRPVVENPSFEARPSMPRRAAVDATEPMATRAAGEPTSGAAAAAKAESLPAPRRDPAAAPRVEPTVSAQPLPVAHALPAVPARELAAAVLPVAILAPRTGHVGLAAGGTEPPAATPPAVPLAPAQERAIPSAPFDRTVAAPPSQRAFGDPSTTVAEPAPGWTPSTAAAAPAMPDAVTGTRMRAAAHATDAEASASPVAIPQARPVEPPPHERTQPEPPAPVEASATTWPWPQAVLSRHAPLLFIVNALLEDGLYPDFTRPRDPGQQVPLWALLAGLARAWRLPADELQAALQERCPDWTPPDLMPDAPGAPAGSWPVWLAAYARSLRRRLCRRLGLRPAGWPQALTLASPARLWLSEAEWVAEFDLGAHDVAWRLAGLDRDPGWLPSTGVSLRFVFHS